MLNSFLEGKAENLFEKIVFENYRIVFTLIKIFFGLSRKNGRNQSNARVLTNILNFLSLDFSSKSKK